jgi:dihydroxyacetone kinase-like predicted kinase
MKPSLEPNRRNAYLVAALASFIYGFSVTEEEAESLADSLAEEYPDIEFEVQYGGQPLYYYLISIE